MRDTVVKAGALGQPLAQGSRRVAFGCPGRQCRLGRHNKPIAVLHQPIAKTGKTALLPVAFLEQARILVRRRSVRLVGPLRLAEIRLPVAPATAARPSSPWVENSSSTPRPSAKFRRLKNAPRSTALSPPEGRAAKTETLARSPASAGGRGSWRMSTRRKTSRRSTARRTSETACRTPAVRPIAAPSGLNREAATAWPAAVAPAGSTDVRTPRKAPKTPRRDQPNSGPLESVNCRLQCD